MDEKIEEFMGVIKACKQYLETLSEETQTNDCLKEIEHVNGLVVLYESKLESALKNEVVKEEIEVLNRCLVFENNFPKPDLWVLEEIKKEIKKLEDLIL